MWPAPVDGIFGLATNWPNQNALRSALRRGSVNAAEPSHVGRCRPASTARFRASLTRWAALGRTCARSACATGCERPSSAQNRLVDLLVLRTITCRVGPSKWPSRSRVVSRCRRAGSRVTMHPRAQGQRSSGASILTICGSDPRQRSHVRPQLSPTSQPKRLMCNALQTIPFDKPP